MKMLEATRAAGGSHQQPVAAKWHTAKWRGNVNKKLKLKRYYMQAVTPKILAPTPFPWRIHWVWFRHLQGMCRTSGTCRNYERSEFANYLLWYYTRALTISPLTEMIWKWLEVSSLDKSLLVSSVSVTLSISVQDPCSLIWDNM